MHFGGEGGAANDRQNHGGGGGVGGELGQKRQPQANSQHHQPQRVLAQSRKLLPDPQVQPGLLEPGGQREPAAEQQKDSPGHAIVHRLPIQREIFFFTVPFHAMGEPQRKNHQQESHRHGNGGVVQVLRPGKQRGPSGNSERSQRYGLTKNPQQRGCQEHASDKPFGAAHLSESLIFLGDHLTGPLPQLQFVQRDLTHKPAKVQPHQRQKNDNDGNGKDHPAKKSDLRLVRKTGFVEPGKNDIGRGANQGSDPADTGGISQAQHQGQPQVLFHHLR